MNTTKQTFLHYVVNYAQKMNRDYIQDKNIREETPAFLIQVKECKHSSCFGWCFSVYF